jgi:2-polyprenyl-3-methyl-5-hydroxy-6-metoxy-1,4-benzoquinol methylase
MGKKDTSFDVAGFEEFRKRAQDDGLSPSEKIGFPKQYREGKSELMIADIVGKLAALRETNKQILDIGPGCGDLATAFCQWCGNKGHRLVLVDSAEMLAHLPDAPYIQKVDGRFPECLATVSEGHSGFDAIIAYSVIQYVFAESNLTAFVDAAASLLRPGGQLLIGDIPNASRRNRFMASEAGRAYHKAHFDPSGEPDPKFNQIPAGEIDDGVVLGLLARLRGGGYDAYIVPQGEALPMANRREDILVLRP